jgi:hypothetical protein
MVVVDSQPQETSASINSKVKGAVPIGCLQISGLRCSSNGLVCPHVAPLSYSDEKLDEWFILGPLWNGPCECRLVPRFVQFE